MNKRKFTRAETFVWIGAFLISLLAFVSPVLSDTLPVVKAPQGDFKVRPGSSDIYFYDPTLDFYDPKGRFDERLLTDGFEPLDAMAVDYIRDPYIRNEIAGGYRCGTPTGIYLAIYRKPPEAWLRKRAARMEAEYLSLLDKRYLVGYPLRPLNNINR